MLPLSDDAREESSGRDPPTILPTSLGDRDYDKAKAAARTTPPVGIIRLRELNGLGTNPYSHTTEF
jgi:hypothetical protein